MARASHYGCTADHPEFTCLDAWRFGPKKFRKRENWCETCFSFYSNPAGEREVK